MIYDMIVVVTVTSEQIHWHSAQCAKSHYFFYHGTPEKTHGVGATVSCLIKFLHPSELIWNKFPNPVNGQRLDGCVTVNQELKKINRRDQLSLIVQHANFVNNDGEPVLLHGVKKHFKIDMEGDLDLFFDAVTTSEKIEVATASVVPLPQPIDEEVSGWNDGGANDLLVRRRRSNPGGHTAGIVMFACSSDASEGQSS